MDLIMMCISCALCEIVFIGCCVCVFVGVLFLFALLSCKRKYFKNIMIVIITVIMMLVLRTVMITMIKFKER